MPATSDDVAPPGDNLGTLLGQLAARIWEPRAPQAVRTRVRAVVLDVVSAAASGLTRADLTAAHRAFAVGDGPSTVLGRRTGLPPGLAAFLNAMPVAREQLQDGHRQARGHPASHVVPAVLAAAEAADADGSATLSAILAGYECAVRIGLAMDGTPRGVHDIATWATLGAAAGVAHVLTSGDAEAVAAAVESSAALPTVPDAHAVFAGWTSQHLYLASGAQTAVLHGQAAAAGIRAAPGTLERHFARWIAADPDGFTARLHGLASPSSAPDDWTILDGYLKRHPTCALLHGVNDAVEDLRHYRPEEISAVTVQTYAAAAKFDQPVPRNELEARFSIPWSVATGLVHGTVDTRAFELDTIRDPELRALATRVRVEHDPALDPGYPVGRPAVVTVDLRDGTRRSAACAGTPRGDGPGALNDPSVSAKPARLLTRAVGERGADAVIAAVAALGEQGPRQLGDVLRGLVIRRTAPA